MVAASRQPAWQRLIQLAERDPRRSAQLALRWQTQAEPCANCQVAIGWALLRWERLDQAAATLHQAATKLTEADPAYHWLQHAWLLLAQLQGATQDLQARWEAQSANCLAHHQPEAALRARCEQIAQLNLLGQYAQAQALGEAISPLVNAVAARPLTARWLHVRGVAAAGCAQLELATQLLSQAADQFRQLGQRAELARAQFELGWVAMRREQLAMAATYLEDAQARYHALDLPLRVALCKRDRGVVAALQGDYAQALSYGLAARSIFEQLGRSYYTAGCDLNLGNVAYLSGWHDLALVMYQSAEQAFRAHADQARAVMAGRNQVLVACALGEPAQALTHADTLISEAQTLSDRLEVCELAVARARALRDLGRINEAVQAWQVAAEQFGQLGNHAAAAKCQLELAWIALDQGDLDLAQTRLNQAAPLLMDRAQHAWRSAYAYAQIAERRGELPVARDHYLAASAHVAQIRRRLASEHASSGVFQQAQRLHQAAMQLTARLDDHAALFQLLDHQQSLMLERQRALPPPTPALATRQTQARTAFQTALAEAVTPIQRNVALDHYLTTLLYARHSQPLPAIVYAPFELEALRETLQASYGTNWSLLGILLSDDALLILGLTPEASFCTAQPLDSDLRDLIAQTTQPQQRQMTYRDLRRLRDPRQPAWQSLAQLGAILIPPWLQARLNPAHRLLIMPAGPLHSLAWAALRLNGAWLCEQAVLVYLPHLRGLHFSTQLVPQVPALLLGCSQFAGRAPDLPIAAATLDLVARHWPGPTSQWRDQDASCAILQRLHQQDQLRPYGLIHLASHAQLGGADGLLAQIRLADGDLLLDELVQLRLGADLVVLSACEGAAGTVLPGDEVLSLNRALLAAGARMVLASLWTVYDQGILALLDPFYAHLAEHGDAALALAQAQRHMLSLPDQADSLLHSPYGWAGFTLVLG